MKKILPVTQPRIRAYLRNAFPMSVISDIAVNSGWIYNKFIEIYYNFQEDYGSYVNYKYYDFFINDGVFIKGYNQIPNKTEKDKYCLIQYIKELIDCDTYFFGNWNEEIIPGKEAYQKWFFKHACFIYGYDDVEEIFYTEGYLTDSRKWMNHTISFELFLKAVLNDYYNKDYVFFEDFKLNEDMSWKFDYIDMIQNIKQYLNSYNELSEEKIIYGVKGIEKYFNDIETKVLRKDINLHMPSLYAIYEHKLLMLERMRFLNNKGYLTDTHDCIKKYEKLCKEFEIIINLLLKYNVSGRTSYGFKIKEKGIEVQNEENTILRNYFNLLEMI